MRLVLLLVAAILTATPGYGGQVTPSTQGEPPSSQGDAAGTTLPVSVERIRRALFNFPDQPLLRGVNEQPDFSITIEQPLTLEEFFKNTDFSGGPVPPGGLYAHELQRIISDPNRRPMAQPYAAFTSGELAQVAATSTLGTLLSQYLARTFRDVFRNYGEQAARQEVRRVISAYCAGQPGNGRDIEICRER